MPFTWSFSLLPSVIVSDFYCRFWIFLDYLIVSVCAAIDCMSQSHMCSVIGGSSCNTSITSVANDLHE